MLEKNIKSLTRKRSDENDFEEKRTSKKQNVNKLAFDNEVDFNNNEIFNMNPSIVFTDNDTNEEILSNYEEYCEEESQIDMASADTIESWVLSSGKDVGKELSKYRENIPHTKAYYAFFGILDLSGEDTEDFNNNIKLSDMEDEQERPFYELMDKISEISEFILIKKPFDLITGIESCDNIKVNAIRRLTVFRHKVAFGSNFTNAITKGVLTFDRTYHYEEGEIQGLASSVITNMKSRPIDRSLIGQKKWMDKVDLSVALRDVLVNEGIENNGVRPENFCKLFTLGVHTFR
ncbi:6115_t:CDS:2, partial [Acaulospora morrowiae]